MLIVDRKKQKKKLALYMTMQREAKRRKERRKMKKKKKKAKKKMEESKKRMKERNKELKQVLQEYLAGQTETYASYYEDNETNVELPQSPTSQQSTPRSPSASMSSSRTKEKTSQGGTSAPKAIAQEIPDSSTPEGKEATPPPPPPQPDPGAVPIEAPPHDDTYEQVDLGGVEQAPQEK
ncbi:hypothetical protein NECAME_11915 [Necator americanus]|uniref:Uncharacterized protein n=1 Tax=Necator americanus TaxID=51031 RepID=W2T563_NECAM|nr:hypothetical protein NECAME_11915 [Necator americanus]ETN76112.1 hypothetical protein NECAME_11915 [Necator americanus]